jgi:hypothetical protein
VNSLRSSPWLVWSACLLAGAGALSACSGCQFFTPNFASQSSHSARRSILSQFKPGKDSIQLDVLIIDRRVDDPLIGSMLWQEIDQVGALPGETRELLSENGCLVGHAAATPPITLLQLMGMVPEIEGIAVGGRDRVKPKVAGRKYSLRSGTETEIQVSDLMPDADVAIVDPGKTRDMHFERVRFVFQMKPIRLQDGWVRVELLPEIHHGDMQLRPMPTDDVGWALKSAQNVEVCFSQKFAVTLNVGESAVITAAPNAPGSLGDKFFRRDQNGERRQRLLVIRLADMGRTIRPVD